MRRKALSLLWLLPTLATSGCYLAHVTAGQLRLLHASRPIEDILADPETPPDLAARLRLVQATRRFASSLGLEVGDQYTSYVDWPGDRVVTTVVATEPGQVEPAGFWFPVIGTVPYKGFFDPARADREAERLRARGLDVCEVAVPAYSTLGWLDDPLTSPMLRMGDGPLVETLIHELVHATAYAPDQARFDEGVATFIGEEGSVRFYASQPELAAQRRAEVSDDRRLDAAVLAFRQQVEALYAASAPGPARDRQRQALERETRSAIAAIALPTRDPAELGDGLRLNDACLALWGTYAADLDRYAEQLGALGGNLAAFVTRVQRAAGAEDPLAAMLGSAAGFNESGTTAAAE